MTSELPKLGEPVTVGSISFQTMISSAVLIAPQRRLDLTTSFQLGMKITNNSPQDYYFLSMRRSLVIEHKVSDYNSTIRTDSHGYNYFYDCNSETYLFPSNDNVVLAEAGKSINLVFQGVIAWRKPYKKTRKRKKKDTQKTLIPETYVLGEESDYELIVYFILKDTPNFFLQPFSKEARSYKIGCEYRMIEILEYSKENYHSSYFSLVIPNLDQIWVGIVHTPFIEFQIVEG